MGWRSTVRIQGVDDKVVFLPAEEVPPNLLRLKPGDVLRWARDVRTVTKVGYRKTAADYLDEARRRLNEDPNGRRAALSLRAVIFGSASTFDPAPKDLDWWLARRLAAFDRLGGPERGVHVNERSYGMYRSTPVTVQSTRIVRVGRYYPPFGGGEDYEDGGLAEARSVVLVRCDLGEVLSGDLQRS
jgi:hypothetical protein